MLTRANPTARKSSTHSSWPMSALASARNNNRYTQNVLKLISLKINNVFIMMSFDDCKKSCQTRIVEDYMLWTSLISRSLLPFWA